MTDILHLKFEHLTRPVALVDCRHLTDYFPLIFSDWAIEDTDHDQAPIIKLSQDKNGVYYVEAEWLEKVEHYKDKVDAVCSLVAKVVRAWTLCDPNILCLHGAAVKIGEALVIFPSKYRAGKSLLSACLASRGIELFGDDVLPISLTEGLGIAAGLAPRLRLPIPDNLGNRSRDFIDSRTALMGKRYLYLDLREQNLAKHNSKAAIGAFVLLEREAEVETMLAPISESEVLRQVVWQNFARDVSAPSILRRLSQIVGCAQCFRMRYDRAEDAVNLLTETFSHQIAPQTDYFDHWPANQPDQAYRVAGLPKGFYLRCDGISEIKKGGEIFLADAKGAAIHHLNAIGSAIWGLLAEPATPEQVTELMRTAFPEIDDQMLEKDVLRLIKSLKRKNLVSSGAGRIQTKRSIQNTSTRIPAETAKP